MTKPMGRCEKVLFAFLATGAALLNTAVSGGPAVARTTSNHTVTSEAESVSGTAKWLSSLNQEDDRMIAKVRFFLGKTRNVLPGHRGTIAEQVIDYIAVPSEPFVARLPDGNWLATGHYPRAGDAMGTVLIDRFGAVRGTAVTEIVNLKSVVFVYVADDEAADLYVSDIKKWSGISAEDEVRVVRFGKLAK